MGVKDLWQLLERCGVDMTLEELSGLALSVDVSLWLHQIVKGMRTAKVSQSLGIARAPCFIAGIDRGEVCQESLV